MELYKKKEDCCGCAACLDACPAGAISMVQDQEGFFYPKIKETLCTDCGRCIKVCPLRNRSEAQPEHLYFGAQAREDTIRATSSSGGILSILARYVFQHEGVVYGAAYHETMKVMHKEASGREQLEQLKRTKYVQSDLRTVYQRIEDRLKDERWVLFCGTPCQAQALKLFLGKSYDKLIIVDLICYGVPSPGIWNSYVKYLEDKKKGKMTDFSFRDKRNRDNGHMCAYVIDGAEYTASLYNDQYCMMYFSNLMLRPSCHTCKFCTPERDSDITIGDFWGIEKVKPDMDDGMGTSVVILHTQKARDIWEQIREDMTWFACKKEEILQPRLIGPTRAAPERKLFMILYRLVPFSFFLKMVRGMLWLRGISKRQR